MLNCSDQALGGFMYSTLLFILNVAWQICELDFICTYNRQFLQISDFCPLKFKKSVSWRLNKIAGY